MAGELSAVEEVRRRLFDAGMLAVAAAAVYALVLVVLRGGAVGMVVGAAVLVIAAGREATWQVVRRWPAAVVATGGALGAAMVALADDGRLVWLPMVLLLATLSTAVARPVVLVATTLAAAGTASPLLDGDLSARERRLAAAAGVGVLGLEVAAAALVGWVERRVRAARARENGPRMVLAGAPPAPLTQRQWEVVALSGRGLRHAEIAAQLGISVHQVRRLLREARDRTRTRTSSELVAWAVAREGYSVPKMRSPASPRPGRM